jgi:hypothetical protein
MFALPHSGKALYHRKRTQLCPEIPPLFRLETSLSAKKTKLAQKIRNTVLIIDKSQHFLSNTPETLLVAPRLLPPECRSVNQAPKQPLVGRGEIALAQALSRSPFVRGAANGSRLALGQAAQEEFQVNGFSGIVVGDLLERLAKRNLDVQFLAEFSNEAILKGLARLAFTTWDFPQAS